MPDGSPRLGSKGLFLSMVDKHKTSFKFLKTAHPLLRIADCFVEDNPHIIYWTEVNDSKKGLYYMYKDGVYKPASTLEIERIVLDYIPKDSFLPIPSKIPPNQFNCLLKYIERLRFFYRTSFNPDGIINFRNGFFYIESGELREHSMEIISTNQLPYNYDPQATCPYFFKALNEAVEGDEHKISVIQEFAGYCLTKMTKYDKVLFFIGAAGSGKSTILAGIEAMLGKENVSNLSMAQLCDAKFAGVFIDKLANIDREIPKNIANYEDILKKIVSGEDITVDTKFIPSYNAKPFCKLIFAANDMPNITDSSDGIFRRMILIDCNNVIKNIDHNLREYVRDEGAGIFNWAFEGMKRLLERGEFKLSHDLKANVEDLKMLNNSVYYFITETYEFGLDNEKNIIPVDVMYEKYKSFCGQVGIKGIFKKMTFSKEVKKIFRKQILTDYKRINTVLCRVWTGIREKRMVEYRKPDNNNVDWDE